MLIDYVSRQVETVYSLDIGLYPNAVAPGCMEVTGVALNGEMAYYTLDGPVLTLPLLNELDPGQSCRIYIRFSIDLTMGYGNGLDLICPLPLVAEDRDMLEEPGAPEYGAPRSTACGSMGIRCWSPRPPSSSWRLLPATCSARKRR